MGEHVIMGDGNIEEASDTSIPLRRAETRTWGTCAKIDDVVALKKDFNALQERKTYATLLSVMVVAEWTLLAAQLIGLLTPDATWLMDSDREPNLKYHVLCFAQSLLVIAQVLCITKWYQLRLKNMTLFDHIWVDVSLADSPLRVPWLLEIFGLLLHEPPFFVLFWSESYKLQIFALLRVYTFFNLCRGRSYSVTMGGRIICTIARVHNNKWFQVRMWVYEHPTRFVVACATVGWFLLSVAMFMAENDDDLADLSFQESMWLTFITMTTVGYGDFSPKSGAGRAVACTATIHGLISSALLIDIVSKSLTLTENQKSVVDFIHEAKMGSRIESTSAEIVRQAVRLYVLKVKNRSEVSQYDCGVQIKHLCSQNRTLRRQFKRFTRSIHAPMGTSNWDVSKRLDDLEATFKQSLSPSAAPASSLPYGAPSFIGRARSLPENQRNSARARTSHPAAGAASDAAMVQMLQMINEKLDRLDGDVQALKQAQGLKVDSRDAVSGTSESSDPVVVTSVDEVTLDK